MDQTKLKLNLGCGYSYQPGYINIDRYNSKIADKTCSVEDLPFPSNSLDEIRAYHLIEHFDYVNCKYALSEWFRVLKNNKYLIIKTPDLKKSANFFIFSKNKNPKKYFQWIYGLDSPGLSHKTGFSPALIKKLLAEIGFSSISVKRRKIHKYAVEMEIVCRKPNNDFFRQMMAQIRTGLKKELAIRDSTLLNYVEDCLDNCIAIHKNKYSRNKEAALKKIAASSSLRHPQIAKIIISEFEKFGLIDGVNLNYGLLDYLAELKIQQKIIDLWKKRKKTIRLYRGEINTFISDLENLICQSFGQSELEYKSRLKYFENLNTDDTKIFNLEIVQLKARELFNLGVKEYCRKNYQSALYLFSESIKINPLNPLAYWNRARLYKIFKNDIIKAREDLKNAQWLAVNKKQKNEITKELAAINNETKNYTSPRPENIIKY